MTNLEQMYACDPPCGQNECCVHFWNDVTDVGRMRSLHSPIPKLLTTTPLKRRMVKSCESLQSAGSRCDIMHALEMCPCGRGLVCKPDNGDIGIYFGTCIDGKHIR